MFARMNRYLLVAVSLVLTAVFVTIAPWTSNLITLLVTLAPPEFFGCAIGMGKSRCCYMNSCDYWTRILCQLHC